MKAELTNSKCQIIWDCLTENISLPTRVFIPVMRAAVGNFWYLDQYELVAVNALQSFSYFLPRNLVVLKFLTACWLSPNTSIRTAPTKYRYGL